MTVGSSRVCVIVVSTLVTCAMPALGRDKPFPQELLKGKTIAVVSHYGLTSTAHDRIKEDQFKTSAEAVLRASHQLTVIDKSYPEEMLHGQFDCCWQILRFGARLIKPLTI